MRILLLTESAAAGVGRHVLDLAEGLAETGCTVHLLYNPLHTDSMFRARRAGLEERTGVHVHQVPMRHTPHPGDLRSIATLYRYVRDHGPFDIAHCHSTKAGMLGRIAFAAGPAAIVYTPHAPLTMKPGLSGAARVCARFHEVALALPTRRLIAVSQDERSHLVQLGIPQAKVAVIPNGVARRSMQRLQADRAEQRAVLDVDDGAVCIGFVGRVERQKRVDLLVQAFNAIPGDARRQATLVIVGDGSERAALEEKVRQTPGLAPQVRFTGETRCGARWMPAFDVFALASDYEGMPYVLIEALAAGLPLVSTNTGGASTLIRHGWNGFITPVGDAGAFAGALARLVLRPALRQRMKLRSRIRSEAFTTRQMIAGTLAAYQQAVAVRHTFPEYSQHATVLKP